MPRALLGSDYKPAFMWWELLMLWRQLFLVGFAILIRQVDDLRSVDALEEEISATGVVMIFVSKGYFLSKSERTH